VATNKFKNQDERRVAKSSRRRHKKKGAGGQLFGSLNISAYYVFKNIHYIFFLAFLGILYIANSHYAVKTIKEIKEIQADLEKVSWESNARKSKLMYESMQSRVVEKVGHLGLKPIEGKPKKIELSK
jgi:hypothetical protein